MARSARNTEKDIESLKHREARRKHIPTAELEALVSEAEQAPKAIRWKRNTDLDPQLVWRGKDEQDAEDLMVDSVPIYIQEKIQPEAIIRDLLRRSEACGASARSVNAFRCLICSETSTASPNPAPSLSSTGTTRTGRTG
jgi:hypothetical protein